MTSDTAADTTDRPILSVVIPNWNGLAYLEICLSALQAQTLAALEVIVVDNASHDGSQSFVRQRFPAVRLLELSENRGFTGACNAGMNMARGQFIALLNNDTEADPGWAAALVDAFAQGQQVGIVASKMLLFDQRDVFHNAGDGFTTDGRAFNRGVWQQDVGQYQQVEPVFSACGGASAYRRTMLDQIGLLDDDFFFLMEDIDLGVAGAAGRLASTLHTLCYRISSPVGDRRRGYRQLLRWPQQHLRAGEELARARCGDVTASASCGASLLSRGMR